MTGDKLRVIRSVRQKKYPPPPCQHRTYNRRQRARRPGQAGQRSTEKSRLARLVAPVGLHRHPGPLPAGASGGARAAGAAVGGAPAAALARLRAGACCALDACHRLGGVASGALRRRSVKCHRFARKKRQETPRHIDSVNAHGANAQHEQRGAKARLAAERAAPPRQHDAELCSSAHGRLDGHGPAVGLDELCGRIGMDGADKRRSGVGSEERGTGEPPESRDTGRWRGTRRRRHTTQRRMEEEGRDSVFLPQQAAAAIKKTEMLRASFTRERPRPVPPYFSLVLSSACGRNGTGCGRV